jgi:hypothetical protein
MLRLHDHTQTHHTRYDFSGRAISPTLRPLPDDTQHSKETDTMPPAGFEPEIHARKRPQTNALDRAVTEIGNQKCGANELNSPQSKEFLRKLFAIWASAFRNVRQPCLRSKEKSLKNIGFNERQIISQPGTPPFSRGRSDWK